MSDIQYLPIVDDSMIQPKFDNSVRFSPHNSKVFAGVMYLVNEFMNANIDSLPFELNQEIVDVWSMYYNGPNSSEKNAKSAFNMNKTRKVILAIGKTAITSCPFAGDCMEYCYADAVERTYKASAAMHMHNYAMIFGQSVDVILERFESGFDNRTCVVRIDDSGDIITYNEMKAWRLMAINHPGTLFYGYTKSTPYLYNLRKEFGSLPSNLVLNVSSTNNPVSAMFKDKLDTEYPNEFNTCWIVDSEEMHSELSDLPFNNEEEMAMTGTSDFLIGLHGTFQKGTPEFDADKYFVQFASDNNVKIC